MKTRLLLAVLSGALALGTSAAASTTNDTVSGSYTGNVGTVGTINATYSETFLRDSTGNWVSCQGVDSRFYIPRAHARHQLMYDTLLAAKLSGRTVELHYEMISNQCWVKRVILQ
jgi:hypothetical protein